MSSSKRFEPYLKYLGALGLEVVDQTVTGHTHVKFKVTYRGKVRFIIAPHTPSDRRAFLNWKCDARNIARTLQEEAQR